MSQQINLFNPIFLKQKKLFSAMTMLQALALIFVGAIAVTIYARAQLARFDRAAASTALQLKATQAQLAQVQAQFAPRTGSKDLEQKIRKVEADLKVEQQILSVAQKGNFGSNNGYSEYFRALARQIVDGLWLTGFTIVGAGNGIELHGRALRPELVPEYVNRLKREPVLSGKSFSALQMDVPMVDGAGTGAASGTAAGVAGAGRVPARYIEFSLQSSAVTAASDDAQTGLPGAIRK